MAGIDDLKVATNPFAQLAKDTKKVVEQNEIKIKLQKTNNKLLETNNELLRDLCNLKRKQQRRDDAFRVSWASAKVKDMWLGFCVITIALFALYLDYFKGWPIIKWFKGLIG